MSEQRRSSSILGLSLLAVAAVVLPSLAASSAFAAPGAATENIVYVAADGNPDAAGTLTDPVDSVAAARDLLSGKTSSDAPGTVYVRGGSYPVEETTTLSGEENSHVTYTAYRGETVEFTGARTLETSDFEKLSAVSGRQYSSASRLQSAVRDRVYVFDLKAAGVPAGDIYKNGFNWVQQPLAPELLVDGDAQRLAQYPNGDAKMTRNDLSVKYAPQGARDFFSDKSSATKTYEEMLLMPGPIFNAGTSAVKDRFLKWAPPTVWTQQVNQPSYSADPADPYFVDNSLHETDGWLSGHFGTDWATENVRIYSAADDGFNLRSKYPTMYKANSSGGVYDLVAQNILYELDTAGEYYIDRWEGNDVLYYIPADDRIEGKSISLTSLSEPFFTLESVTDVTFNGFDFHGGTGNGVQMLDCESCTIENSEFSHFSLDAIRIGEDNKQLTALAEFQTSRGGHGNRVLNSSFHDLGGGGVWLTGGNRKNLERGDHLVSQNEFWNISKLTLANYTPAITLAGVGNTASHNYIHDTPNMGLQIFGNDMLVTRNHFDRVLTSSADLGAIYSGRDFTYLGNEISYNAFTNIEGERRWAIYLDDGMSAMNIHHNLFESGVEGIYINSGKASSVTDNVFLDHEYASFELSFRTKHGVTLPIPNQKVHFERFSDMLKPGDGTGFTNTQANIDTWLQHYSQDYPGLASWYWPTLPDGRACPQTDAATCSIASIYEDPNSLLVPTETEMARNVLINTPDDGPGGETWPTNWRFTDFDYDHYNPGIDAVRVALDSVEEAGFDRASRQFSPSSPIRDEDQFGTEWIEAWNAGFAEGEAGVLALPDRAALWAVVDVANGLDRNELSTSDYARLQSAINQAVAVDVSGQSTAEQISLAASSLQAVIDAVQSADTTRPEVVLAAPSTPGPFSTLNIRVEATDDRSLSRIVANVYRDGMLVQSTQTPVDGTSVATHTATVSLPDGAYTVKYNARDSAGNVSKTSSFAFTIDTTKPTATVKDGVPFVVRTGDSYDVISFKLHDAGKIDRVTLNGTVKDLANSTWSDVNFVKPLTFGAVKGLNTLVVFDVAGNSETYTFTLN